MTQPSRCGCDPNNHKNCRTAFLAKESSLLDLIDWHQVAIELKHQNSRLIDALQNEHSQYTQCNSGNVCTVCKLLKEAREIK